MMSTNQSQINNPNTRRSLKVFLCHSSNDKPLVRDLYRRLKAEQGIEPWFDEEELLPGQDWNLEIRKAIEATDVVIICLSQGSITKVGYVNKEVAAVCKKGREHHQMMARSLLFSSLDTEEKLFYYRPV